MTENQITTLAREYAGEIHYGDNFFENENKRFLAWLTRRYCLVEKSKAQQVNRCIKTKAVVTVMSVLFPDLGKEVEG